MDINGSTQKTASKKAHLLDVIRFAQGKGPVTDISRQIDAILYRIARGNGQPVPLPQVQRGEFGQFASDPQARLNDLRHDFGFEISCIRSIDGKKGHNGYLLHLNPDGTPKMKASADVATEAPKQPKSERGSAWRKFSFGKAEAPQHETVKRLLWETGAAHGR